MTITRILLATVAILLCCLLAFGLPHGSEKNRPNSERGLEMLNLFQKYLEKNESSTENPQAIPSTTPTQTRKFYSVFENSASKSQNAKHNSNVGNITPLVPSTNTSENSSEPELNLVLVVDVDEQPPEHKDSEILDVENTATKHVDKIMMDHVLFSKTVRVSRVEEVFEDLVTRNVRRIIKEDRAERIEVSKNNELEAIGNELGIKDLLSL